MTTVMSSVYVRPVPIIDMLEDARFTSNFWKRLDKTKGCWLWTGTCSSGYGMVRFRGEVYLVHRVSFALTNNQSPTILVCHTCDVRNCANPDHLFLGDYNDNHKDAVAKGRNRALQGFEHPLVKVTPEMIREIRLAVGSQSQIGKRFGLTQSHISKIRLGQIWSEVI